MEIGERTQIALWKFKLIAPAGRAKQGVVAYHSNVTQPQKERKRITRSSGGKWMTSFDSTLPRALS